MVIDEETVVSIDETDDSLRAFYEEFSIISKKKPDSPSNRFKLGLVNEALESINQIIGDEYRPIKSFKTFDDSELPFVSDVVMMLSQYIKAIDRIRRESVRYKSGTPYWVNEETGTLLKRTRRPVYEG